MKLTSLTLIPLTLLGVAACEAEEQTVTVTVARSEFVGWTEASTTDVGETVYTVTEGSDFEIEGNVDNLIVTVDEIGDNDITFSFGSPMARGTTGGGSDMIYSVTVQNGRGVDVSTPSEDAVTIYRIDVEFDD